jgi:hypothetical protein
MRRRRLDVDNPLQIRDLMDYPQLQNGMVPQPSVDASGPTRVVLRRAKPRALFGVEVQLVERAG